MTHSIEQIEKILSDLQHAIREKKIIPVPRKVNMDTLARLGMMWSDAIAELQSLSYSNYDSGPLIDRDRPFSDPLWIFKKPIHGKVIYIKLKIEYQSDGFVKIISFHIERKNDV